MRGVTPVLKTIRANKAPATLAGVGAMEFTGGYISNAAYDKRNGWRKNNKPNRPNAKAYPTTRTHSMSQD